MACWVGIVDIRNSMAVVVDVFDAIVVIVVIVLFKSIHKIHNRVLGAALLNFQVCCIRQWIGMLVNKYFVNSDNDRMHIQ